MLTLVMYHYVRDLAGSAFPRIKGRTLEEFDAQLDHIAVKYRVCSLADVARAANGEEALPPKACVLTFDDGFIDHYASVFPRLAARDWSGAFFPPACAIESREMLDVHKLHFVLAKCEDAERIAAETLTLVSAHRRDHSIPGDDELRRKYTAESRFDSPSIVFFKRLLQHGLPAAVRTAVVGELFSKYVASDARSFADELYMTTDQLREMRAGGMEIGGHGDRHEWLGHLSASEQAIEIERTVEFLTRIHNRRPSGWTMCYPYGSFNATTIEQLRAAGCVLGLTTVVGVNADLTRPFELQRLDTNDLPTRMAAPAVR